MPDAKTIHDQIRARLAEVEQLLEPLRAEAEQLTRLAATFDGHTSKAKAPAASTQSRTKTAKATPPNAPPATAALTRAKRGRPTGSGSRAHQALAKISEQPGITMSELAKALGINANYLYRVLPRLEQDAKISKQGKGYHPLGDAQPVATTTGRPIPA